MRQASVFISHGTPMTVFQDDEYTQSIHRFFSERARPKAVIVVSAHGTTPEGEVEISASARSRLIYDFRGFPSELYQLDYAAPGAPELTGAVVAALSNEGFSTHISTRGLDHGVWVPMRIAYPNADVPVIQVSMPYPTQPEKALLLGRALAPLREQGMMVVGSGSLTHNLGRLNWSGKGSEPFEFAQKFAEWARDRLELKDVSSLVAFEADAPDANLAHPTTEHYFPLLVTVGASLPGDELNWIYQGIEYGSLSLDCFALLGRSTERAGDEKTLH